MTHRLTILLLLAAFVALLFWVCGCEAMVREMIRAAEWNDIESHRATTRAM